MCTQQQPTASACLLDNENVVAAIALGQAVLDKEVQVALVLRVRVGVGVYNERVRSRSQAYPQGTQASVLSHLSGYVQPQMRYVPANTGIQSLNRVLAAVCSLLSLLSMERIFASAT